MRILPTFITVSLALCLVCCRVRSFSNRLSSSAPNSDGTAEYAESSSRQQILEDALNANGIKNLEDFLKDVSAQDNYYLAAASYYGGKNFIKNKNCYTSILTSLKKIMEGSHPAKNDFAAEVWKKPEGMGVYHLPLTIKSYGKTSTPERLKSFVSELYVKLKVQTKEFGERPTSDAQNSLAQKYASEMKSYVTDYQEKGSHIKGNDKKGYNQRLFAAVKMDPRTVAIASFVTREALLASPLLDATITSDPDFFLVHYEEFLKRAEQKADALGVDFAGFSAALTEAAPSLKNLLLRTDIFTDIVRQGSKETFKIGKRNAADMVFYPVLRKFHGLFKGLTNDECARASQARFSTGLLPESQLHFMEQKGVFEGFIELVALDQVTDNGTPTGKKIYSPTFAVGQFGKNLFTISEDGQISSELVFHNWLRKVTELMPKNFVGVGKSNSTLGRNVDGGVTIGTVILSPTYHKSAKVMGQNGLSIGDRGRLLAEVLKTSGHDSYTQYSVGEFYFITDLIESQATAYTILDPQFIPPKTVGNLSQIGSNISTSGCDATNVAFELGDFNFPEALPFLLGCMEQMSQIITKNTEQNTVNISDLQTYFLILDAFASMEQKFEFADLNLKKQFTDPAIQTRLLTQIKFSSAPALGGYKAQSIGYVRSVVKLVAKSAPPAEALNFVREALSLLPDINLWNNVTSEVLDAITKAERRRKLAQSNDFDSSLLDDATAISRVKAELESETL